MIRILAFARHGLSFCAPHFGTFGRRGVRPDSLRLEDEIPVTLALCPSPLAAVALYNTPARIGFDLFKEVFTVVRCPECAAAIDVDEDEVEEGEILNCPECEVEIEVVQTHPVRLNVISEEEEDEEAEELEDKEALDEEEEEIE